MKPTNKEIKEVVRENVSKGPEAVYVALEAAGVETTPLTGNETYEVAHLADGRDVCQSNDTVYIQ